MSATSQLPWQIAVVACAFSGGCSEWPRSGHLPADESYLAPGDAAHASITWGTPVDEAGGDFANLPDADPPPPSPAAPLVFGDAPVLTGSINGTGWNTNGQDQPGCSALSPSHDQFPGFYLKDVDLATFELQDDSFVCGVGSISPEKVNGSVRVLWDFVLFSITPNDNPDIDASECWHPVVDGPAAVGSNMSSRGQVWGENLSAGRYGVLFGAYNPTSTEEVQYTLGLAVFAPFAENRPSACPQLAEVSQ